MNSRNKDEDGEELEPFNLRQEMDEGYFDQSGNYIRRKIIKTQDEIDNPDEFLDNIDKMEIYQVYIITFSFFLIIIIYSFFSPKKQ